VEKKENELYHVRTRLSYRQDKKEFKFPIILPHTHPLIDQLIRMVHFNLKHAGVQIVLGYLREKFWIARGRQAVKKVINKCVVCRRYSTRKPAVTLAPLPEDRVKSAKVFEIVGVNLAGPLFANTGEIAWIVLFTCAVYRCIHLELVDSLCTAVFLDSFPRFMARRGTPKVVYSDNRTNFV